ncbi:MAG: hypothetical protein DMF80_05900 [Acidobacteria bacterium]|nr:MAG: hypothetical protein DMF80_05900 [Acidobacteriota bacterium]
MIVRQAIETEDHRMEKDTGRVEAFSDGVFAIAITLLVLEIRVPELEAGAPSGRLLSALAHLWPSYVAFVFSFFVILIMWINHHEFLRWVRKPDYPFLFANGLVLMMVTFVPFPTGVVARNLGSDAARGAVAFYCATFLCASLAYQALFLSVARKRPTCLPPGPGRLRAVDRARVLERPAGARRVRGALRHVDAPLLSPPRRAPSRLLRGKRPARRMRRRLSRRLRRPPSGRRIGACLKRSTSRARAAAPC